MSQVVLDFQQKARRPVNTPMTTRNLKLILLTYEDDTSLELEVVDQQGFHRISEYEGANGRFIIHEVYLTYGEKDGLIGQNTGNS